MPSLSENLEGHFLNKRIEKIKNGDERERENVIRDYIPFIIKTVSNKINRYIETENDLEYIIGLEAFNEAIDRYESSKGSFINYAGLVIRSRLTDYMRKSKKLNKIISINQFEEENTNAEVMVSIEDFTDSMIIKNEIENFNLKLAEFNITLNDLVKESPKHKDTKLNAICIAKHIFFNERLNQELLNKKKLPTSMLIKDLGVSRKVLNRSKKIIIATVLILNSNLDTLKNYIFEIEGGSTHDL